MIRQEEKVSKKGSGKPRMRPNLILDEKKKKGGSLRCGSLLWVNDMVGSADGECVRMPCDEMR